MTSRREAFAVILTGAVHLFCEEHLDAKRIFMGFAVVAWGGYLTRRLSEEPSLLQQWGFSWRHFGVSFRVAGGVFLVASMGIAGLAYLRGMLTLHWHIFPLLVVYPVWGLLQQFFLQALLVRNLRVGVTWLHSPWTVTPLAALLFALAHWPDLILTGATFLLGLVFTPMYFRWRNLWPLGLFHGWLGALTYFWLLGRDPWVELLG